MGIDFIRSRAASHTKAWSAEYRRAGDDMFAQHCASYGRSFLATPQSHIAIHEGDPVYVRTVNEQVLVMRELSPIAKIDKPTLDLMESLNAGCGILDAYVDDVNPLANVISVHIGKEVGNDP